MSCVIARNEWRRLFAQPLAWVLLAAVLAVLAYFFLLTLQGFLGLMPKLAGMPSAPGVTDLVALPLARDVNGEAVIASGLSAGETVVTDGQSRLADGTPVRIDKGFSWEYPLSVHGLMHSVITNAWRGDPYRIDTPLTVIMEHLTTTSGL